MEVGEIVNSILCIRKWNLTFQFSELLKMLYPSEESMYCLLPYGKIYMFDEYRQVLQIDVVKQDEEGMTLYLQGPSDYIHAFDLYQIREGQL